MGAQWWQDEHEIGKDCPSCDVGRSEVRVRVRGMERGNRKPPQYFKQLPVMTQGDFLSLLPPLVDLLPRLLPEPAGAVPTSG